MSCYLVQEIDGTSRFTLEDGSGSLLLEFCPPTPPTGGDQHKGGRVIARRLIEKRLDEEDLLAVLLNEL